MWPSGAGRRGSGQNPARAGGEVGREPRGEGLRDVVDRFGLDLGVEVAGGRACGSAQRRRPLWAKLRRGVRRGGAARGVVDRVGTRDGLEHVARR
jgi:hypothetical protein